MGREKRPRAAVVLAAVAALVLLIGAMDAATGGGAGERLELRPREGLSGLLARPWTVAGAHLVHVSPEHLALNLAAIGLVAVAFAPTVPGAAWIGALLLSTLATTAGVVALDPDLASYRGLSGVLHGLAAFGAVALLRRGGADGRLGAVVLLLLLGKVGHELAGGTALMDEMLPGPLRLGRAVPIAHAAGLAGGLLAALSHEGELGFARLESRTSRVPWTQ